jgi:hypothetical protein
MIGYITVILNYSNKTGMQKFYFRFRYWIERQHTRGDENENNNIYRSEDESLARC